MSDKNYETIFNLSSNNVDKPDERSQNLSLDADYYTASINSLIGENTTTLIRLGLKLSQLNKDDLIDYRIIIICINRKFNIYVF